MSSHQRDHSTVTRPNGDANPDDRVRDSSPDDFSDSAEHLRVRVSPEADPGPASSTIVRFDRISNHAETERFSGFDGKSLLSEFDDYVAATRRNGGASRNVGYGFAVGDMVWGKVKSHPWWPGHIYNEAFASSAVRRTKREGHVLVAFFGDSSYGWFEPSELIPFDANFAEKSRQLNSRNFLKAVEEVVDEASRRCGIGLVCRCWNSDNFSATNVEGYLSVKVPDYEPGVYSEAQIMKARNGFRPSQMLAFVKELALASQEADHGSIGFIKNKATVCVFRRQVFEPYDEPYAQAFGVQPLRRGGSQSNQADQPVRHPAKAPLSGPMVMAETLGGEKSTTKSVKSKDTSKKNKYLFKRRDEPSNSFQSASEEDMPDAAGCYIFQKRPLAVSVVPQALEKHEETKLMSQGIVTSAVKADVPVVDQVQPDGSALASQEIMLDEKPNLLDKSEDSSEQKTRHFELIDVSSKSMGRPDFSEEMALPSMVDKKSQSTSMEIKTTIDVKNDENGTPSGPPEDFQQTEPRFQAIAEELKNKKLSVDGVPKKIKAHKRPADDLNSKSSAMEVKKKKKKTLNLQPTSAHLEKPSTSENFGQFPGKMMGKPVSVGFTARDDLLSEPVQGNVSSSNLMPNASTAEVNIELPHVLGDLQALALDPFHCVKTGIPAVARQFFMQFRSFVYQKSLSASPPPPTVTEAGADEVSVGKPLSSLRASDGPYEHARASPPVKPAKHNVRPDDPTKAGRKRVLSDRQEDITAKRLKKIKDAKALAAEKKAATQKTSEARLGEGKESMVQAPPRTAKPDSTRKLERSAKPVEPTMLVIKFPPKMSLPSVAELKARFARFGPIDQSSLRVFWKTSTCRVVFLHKCDAQSAYKYGTTNPSLFGNVGVRYYLREGDSPSDVSDSTKARGENISNEIPRIKDPAVVQHPALTSSQQTLPQPVIQLKSILKKSTVDESGQDNGNGNGGSSKGTPRVKFMLGGVESSSGEQLLVGNRNKVNNVSFTDGGAPSPVAMDFNSVNVQKANFQPSLPNDPLRTQFTKFPQHNLHNSETALRNTPNFINAASTSETTVDISQQMISLLTRCNDIVTNLTGLLGFVPYHPL